MKKKGGECYQARHGLKEEPKSRLAWTPSRVSYKGGLGNLVRAFVQNRKREGLEMYLRSRALAKWMHQALICLSNTHRKQDFISLFGEAYEKQ